MVVFSNNKFSIVLEPYSTRFTSGYKASLLYDGEFITSTIGKTLPRARIKVVERAMELEELALKEKYRNRYNKSRLRKEFVNEILSKNEWYTKLKEFYDELGRIEQ